MFIVRTYGKIMKASQLFCKPSILAQKSYKNGGFTKVGRNENSKSSIYSLMVKGSEPRVTDRKRTKKVLAIFGASDTINFEHEKSTRIAVQMLNSFF